MNKYYILQAADERARGREIRIADLKDLTREVLTRFYRSFKENI